MLLDHSAGGWACQCLTDTGSWQAEPEQENKQQKTEVRCILHVMGRQRSVSVEN